MRSKMPISVAEIIITGKETLCNSLISETYDFVKKSRRLRIRGKHVMKFLLAWLFNESPSKDYVVTNDRWGQGTGKKHGSVYSGPDRWQPGSLIEHKWESAMTIDQKSWGIRRNIKIEDVLTPQELISQVSI